MPIIHGFAKAGEMRRALEIFDMMKMSGCIPTVHAFNALIVGLVEKLQVNFATHKIAVYPDLCMMFVIDLQSALIM